MLTAQDNAILAKTLYDLFNMRNFEEAIKHVAPDAVITNVSSGATFKGPEGFKQNAKGWITAFSNARIENLHLVATESSVTAEFIGRGTHDGPLETSKGTIPATRRKVGIPFCEVLTFKEGKLTEARLYYDTASLMRQLGMGT
jgi:predicted ester cyclase